MDSEKLTVDGLMRIIIDTDIGDDIDDAFALQLALNTEELDILGITTVFRNAYKRAKIAKAILDASGRNEIPVYAGEDTPIGQPICKLVYEKELTRDADGTVNVPHYSEDFSSYEVQRGAEDFILEQARKYPNQITLVCLAPLTNIASAFTKDRDAFRLIKGILMMGGQANGDFAEWNVRCDAVAAKTVFDSGVPIRMVGINATKFCKLTEAEIEEVGAYKSKSGRLLSVMLDKWISDNGNEKSPIIHDGLAVAELTEEFCRYTERNAGVSADGESKGKIVEGTYPIKMAVEVKDRQFIDYLMDRLRRNNL